MSSINGFLLTEERLTHKTLGPRVQKSWILVTSILNSFLGNQQVFFFPALFTQKKKHIFCTKHVMGAYINVKIICPRMSISASETTEISNLNLSSLF